MELGKSRWASQRLHRSRLTSCMPCHPHHFTQPSAAMLGTASALVREAAGQGAVVRREAAWGIGADNLLTVIGRSILI
jgi:hypothetical protein